MGKLTNVLILGVAATGAWLNSNAADKTGYTWSNPTPAAEMREFTTDRPDLTESPFTVDAGHVQLEMDFARTTRNRRDGDRERTWEIAPFNLRFGILNNFELGLFVSPYTRLREIPRVGSASTTAGFGDVTVRGKLNFTGNDAGNSKIAFGVIVDLTLPTSAKGIGADKVEGALTLPVAFELGAGWDGGAMTRVTERYDADAGYQAVWTNSVTIGHALTRTTSGYVEVAVDAGQGTSVSLFSLGAAWMIEPNVQLDAGAVIGLSRAADDLQFFAGISRRF